eukprot:716560-Amphidinium_carterae.1
MLVKGFVTAGRSPKPRRLCNERTQCRGTPLASDVRTFGAAMVLDEKPRSSKRVRSACTRLERHTESLQHKQHLSVMQPRYSLCWGYCWAGPRAIDDCASIS